MAYSFNRTHTYIKRLTDLITCGKLASVTGKDIKTAEAWGREPEHNGNPFGTGKKNPLDCALRLIALAHKEDRSLAHEMSEIFQDYADYLDGREKPTDGITGLLERVIKEHSEAVCAALKGQDWAKAHTEIVQAEIAIRDLKEHVKTRLKEPPVRTLLRAEVNGRK